MVLSDVVVGFHELICLSDDHLEEFTTALKSEGLTADSTLKRIDEAAVYKFGLHPSTSFIGLVLSRPYYVEGRRHYEPYVESRGPEVKLVALYRHVYAHGGQKRRAWERDRVTEARKLTRLTSWEVYVQTLDLFCPQLSIKLVRAITKAVACPHEETGPAPLSALRKSLFGISSDNMTYADWRAAVLADFEKRRSEVAAMYHWLAFFDPPIRTATIADMRGMVGEATMVTVHEAVSSGLVQSNTKRHRIMEKTLRQYFPSD